MLFFTDQKSLNFRAVKLRVRNVIERIAFRIFTLLLIIVDVIVVILDIANAGNTEALDLIAVIICIYFVLEILVRVFAKGCVLLLIFLVNSMPISMNTVCPLDTTLKSFKYLQRDIHHYG